jgi:hypothetical protein
MWIRAAGAVLLGTTPVTTAPAASQTQARTDDERAIHGPEGQIEAATGRNDADALSTRWALTSFKDV